MKRFQLLTSLLYPELTGQALGSGLLNRIQRFNELIYLSSPITSNEGGMGLESSFFLHEIIGFIKPKTVIESGVWKGFTTFIFDQSECIEKIYSFDPIVTSPGFIQYQSQKSTYFGIDWASSMFSKINHIGTLAFFDDHQDQLERLLICYLRGIKWVVFDDNYYYGQGGHASLAEYMRIESEALEMIAKRIFIAPPIIAQAKGIVPLLTKDSFQSNGTLFNALNKVSEYNWLTLVELNDPPKLAHSQLPSLDSIIERYATRLAR